MLVLALVWVSVLPVLQSRLCETGAATHAHRNLKIVYFTVGF